MREKLNLLLEKHCVTIKSNVELVGEHLKRARQDSTDALEAVKEASALAHTLKGSSGTAGFHDICTAATALYDLLKQLSAREEAPPPETLDRAMELYEKLHHISQTASPQSSALYLVMS